MSDDATSPAPGHTPTGSQRTTGGTPRWEPPSPAELQAQMPGYTVEKILGRGGMGAVYKGVQTNLDRTVAIKILPPGVEQEDPSFAERFKNEAKLMAKLNHPAVVAVHDFGTTLGGQLYFAMEYVDGTDVSQMIRSQGKLPPDHALAITAHVCDALSAAHELGIVHRDIKPANVLINMKGQVKVADFGLAKVEEPGTHGLTKTGYAMGTPDFVAPEVLMLGTHIDGRADLYAVGVMLYQMLTGEVPRGAFKPATARLPGLDPRFDPIILKAMQSDREERYQSSTELRRDLDVILTVPFVRQDEPPTSAIPAAQVAQTPPARLGQRQEGGAGMPVRKQPPSAQFGPTYLDEVSAGQAGPVRTTVKKPKSQAPLLLLGAAAVVAAGAYVVFSGGGPVTVRHSETESPSMSAPAPAKQGANNAGQSKAAVSTASQSQTKPAVSTAGMKPGQWVKVTSGFEGAKGIPLNEGRFQFRKGNRLTLGNLDYENVVVRARVRQQGGYAEIRLRETPSSRVAVQAWGHEIKSCANTTTLISTQKLEPALKPGEEGILLGALLNGKIYGLWNGTAMTVSADPTATGAPRRQLFLITGDNIDASDIEYAILDGLPEADALKLMGVDEKGKYLPQQPAAVTAAPNRPPTATPAAIAAATAPTTPPASPAPSTPVSPSPSLPVSSSPSPATTMAAAPASELDQRLAAIESSFQAAVERDANAAFKASIAALDKLYLTALDRALATASKGGKLEEALALREEKQRIEKGDGVPSEVDESTQAPGKVPDTLKTLRKTYRSTTAQHEATKAKAMQPLYDKYDQALAAVQTELTQAQKLDDAMRVKSVREQIAVARNSGEGSAGTPARTTSTGGAATPMTEADKSVRAPLIVGAYTNSLGMKFVAVPETEILMCIHETRRQDYAAFAATNPALDARWNDMTHEVIANQSDNHPVVFVGWDDAAAFCSWLSQKEGKTYRLPTDKEWSYAVGTGRKEKRDKDTTPQSLNSPGRIEYPWDGGYPPKTKDQAGNYADESLKAKRSDSGIIDGYTDSFAFTAPVMSFKPNKLGIYDLGGNVFEWCQDWFDAGQTLRTMRGSSFLRRDGDVASHFRPGNISPKTKSSDCGFRIVLETRAPASPSGAATKPTTPTPTPPAAPAPAPATAAKSDFTNSLGMQFVRVTGIKTLFCIHETRYKDYAAYAAAVPTVNPRWKNQTLKNVAPKGPTDDHPVVLVSWEDAQAFCAWLSQKEGKRYRLPTDEEWSYAVGVGRDEKRKKGDTPSMIAAVPNEFPWGTKWPPSKGCENYGDESYNAAISVPKYLTGYDDGYPTTAPVMSFKPNRYGLYDMGGNVSEWCEDWLNNTQTSRVLRGSSWKGGGNDFELLSSARGQAGITVREDQFGFRIVLETTE